MQPISIDKLYTIEELDNIALNKGAVVYTHEDNGSPLPIIGTIIGGWGTQWLKTNDAKTSGILVLKPGDRRTFSIFMEGQINLYKSFNIDEDVCQKLFDLKIPYKNELLSQISDIANRTLVADAWICYPGVGKFSNRPIWKLYLEVNGYKDHAGLNAKREETLFTIAKMIHGSDIISRLELNATWFKDILRKLDVNDYYTIARWKTTYKEVLPEEFTFFNKTQLEQLKKDLFV